MEYVTIGLCIVVVIAMIIMAILLYNFMQLLSTLNKRMVAVISDILGNIDLSTPHLDKLTQDKSSIELEDILDNRDGTDTEGFNPHNYDPFKEEGIN